MMNLRLQHKAFQDRSIDALEVELENMGVDCGADSLSASAFAIATETRLSTDSSGWRTGAWDKGLLKSKRV